MILHGHERSWMIVRYTLTISNTQKTTIIYLHHTLLVWERVTSSLYPREWYQRLTTCILGGLVYIEALAFDIITIVIPIRYWYLVYTLKLETACCISIDDVILNQIDTEMVSRGHESSCMIVRYTLPISNTQKTPSYTYTHTLLVWERVTSSLYPREWYQRLPTYILGGLVSIEALAWSHVASYVRTTWK